MKALKTNKTEARVTFLKQQTLELMTQLELE